ncbi:MAG: hypothetical protein ABIO36_02355 [Pyrinomonadaceae bacterium]
MKGIFCICAVVLTAFTLTHAQKPNDVISTQIKSLKAEKNITLSYDPGSDSSKIMVYAENFDGKEAKKAGIRAMNFGMAFFYAGNALAAPPESINLTFWILTESPKFAAAHTWNIPLANETLDLGDARYAAKPRESMEYLNFVITHSDLTKITAGSNVKFHLGTSEFTFTPAQLTLLKNLLAVSDTR